MEPNLVTDPKLSGVLEELARREPIFHRAGFGTTRADFERMTEEAFWEVGASATFIAPRSPPTIISTPTR